MSTCLLINLALLISSVSGEDVVFPDDGMVRSEYVISVSDAASIDTVIITYKVLNNNIMGVDSLAVLVNLPPNSKLLNFHYGATSEDAAVNCLGPLENHILPNSLAYIWVIKLLGEAAGAIIEPSGSLEMTCKFELSLSEELRLAPHAAIMYFPEKTVYAVSDSIMVADCDTAEHGEGTQPGAIADPLSVSVSPNPFNSSVRISFAAVGINNQRLDFRVIDILGRTVHSEQATVESDKGELIWSPDSELATGIYFYRLNVSNYRAGGKLLFLK